MLWAETALIVDEVLKPVPKPVPKPLTVVELELVAVVGITLAEVVVGADVSIAGIETGWPTPEHKVSTRLDTAIGPSLDLVIERESGFSYLVGPRHHMLY